MCSQRQGRICLVVVRPVAGPEGPVEQQCSDRMTGSNSYWPVHPAGATGALTSTGSDPRLESNRLPRCSVFKDRVPRGHMFSVVCSGTDWLSLPSERPSSPLGARRSHVEEVRTLSTPLPTLKRLAMIRRFRVSVNDLPFCLGDTRQRTSRAETKYTRSK